MTSPEDEKRPKLKKKTGGLLEGIDSYFDEDEGPVEQLSPIAGEYPAFLGTANGKHKFCSNNQLFFCGEPCDIHIFENNCLARPVVAWKTCCEKNKICAGRTQNDVEQKHSVERKYILRSSQVTVRQNKQVFALLKNDTCFVNTL